MHVHKWGGSADHSGARKTVQLHRKCTLCSGRENVFCETCSQIRGSVRVPTRAAGTKDYLSPSAESKRGHGRKVRTPAMAVAVVVVVLLFLLIFILFLRCARRNLH